MHSQGLFHCFIGIARSPFMEIPVTCLVFNFHLYFHILSIFINPIQYLILIIISVGIQMSEDINQNDLMFKLIKIYIVEYLTTVHGFKTFQHQAVNMLASYAIRCIKKLAISTKRLISMQGVTLPNCLHLVHIINQTKFVDILQLIKFLNKQSSSVTKNVQSFYTGLDNMGRSLFQQQTEQINQHKSESIYPNITFIPYVYVYRPQQNALPIRTPIDENVKKPAQYTYRSTNERVEKVQKNIEKLGNYSVREMRKSLGILGILEQQQTNQKPRKITIKQQQLQKQSNMMKNKFSMINYI